MQVHFIRAQLSSYERYYTDTITIVLNITFNIFRTIAVAFLINFPQKDFQTFAEITMMDSNQFHATCLDTFPPIFYMNDVSRAVVATVHALNKASGRNLCAYTFDAGPNAVSSAYAQICICIYAYACEHAHASF